SSPLALAPRSRLAAGDGTPRLPFFIRTDRDGLHGAWTQPLTRTNYSAALPGLSRSARGYCSDHRRVGSSRCRAGREDSAAVWLWIRSLSSKGEPHSDLVL